MPTVFSNKCKAYCVTVHEDYFAQVEEYPKEVVENSVKASEMYWRLLNDFGGDAMLSVVNPMSFRGILLALKHGLPAGAYVVVNRRTIFDASAGYDVIKRAVERELCLDTKNPDNTLDHGPQQVASAASSLIPSQ